MNIQNCSINGMNQGRDTTIEPAYMKNYFIQNNSTTGTNNYNELINKPKINGVTLIGDKTLNELGTYTKAEIDAKTGVTPSVIGENLLFMK